MVKLDHEICCWRNKYVPIGNRLFYFRKNHIWTYSSKIKVPQCLYYDYICMYLCMSSRYSLHRLSYQAEIWTTKSTCDHEKMHFFLFWNFHFFGRYAHFIRFSQFHAYNTFTLTYHDDWYINSNPWTSRKRCIWLNYIDANMTSLNDIITFIKFSDVG